MAVIVTDDFIVEDAAESNANWIENTTFGGNMSAPATDSNVKAEGATSISLGVSGTGVSGFAVDISSNGISNIRDRHIFIWSFTMQSFLNDLADGAMICYSSSTNGASNVGCITVGGQDTNIGNNKNFQRWCVDPSQPFNVHVVGTPPLEDTISSLCMLWDITSSNGRVSAFCDQVAHGTMTIVTGGTLAVPGNSVDLAANDLLTSRGTFQDVGGIYYILGTIELGDIVATGVSHFSDTGKVWNFDGQHVSASFHKIKFIGNPTGVNAVTFGTEVGTGITADGSGGNVFQAGGLVPFRIDAIDPNVATSLFGCTIINAVSLLEDPWRRVFTIDTPSGAIDVTRSANDLGTNDVSPFPAIPIANDYIAFGHSERFNHATVNIGIAGSGAYAVTWEYSTGTSTWAPLTDVTDGTVAFKTAGINIITFSIPDTWVKGTVNGTEMYYIRALHDGGGQSVSPRITQSSAGMGGGIRAETSSFKAVSGTWTNMDTIRVRNGAILRKITLVNSVASTKSAQLDLGDTDPVADSVRDITIIGANRGLLFQGASVGTTTYNLRNIKFSGNVKDIRVDFPAAATVNINVLEDSSTPTIDNVNGSTVNVIVGQVTFKVIVKDNLGVLLTTLDANVLVQAAAGGTLPVGTDIVRGFTDVNGEIQDIRSYATDQPITGWVRKMSSSPIFRQGVVAGTISTTNGLTITIQLVSDE